MTQPANEQDWQAADALQGMQGPPPTPLPDMTPAPIYQGGAKPGAIVETPRQATADTLNSVETQKDLAEKGGQIAEGEGSELGAKFDAAAAEKTAQAQDYQKALADSTQRHEEDRQRALDAYKEYQQAAGSLKGPKEDYWANKGTSARILSGFAAFASGLGSGLQGRAGENPYLDYVNKEIAQNYDAHKQNVEDLYQKQVAAGKIADDEDSHQKFMQDARLHSYDLASEHVKSELEAIKNRALGQNQRVLAENSIEGLTQQQIAMRKAQAMQEAAAAAAAGAAYRAKAKEAGDKFEEAYKANLAAGYGNEQARTEAAKFVAARGYDRSIIAPIAEANGGTYNTKTGQYEYADVTPKQSGDGLVPTVDPNTGKALKPEEREKLNALRVQMPDGSVRLANNAEDQKKVQQEVTAHQTLTAFTDKLNGPNGWLSQMAAGKLDATQIGEWEGKRKAAIEAYKALSGAEGNTGVGTARLLGEDEFPEPPGVASNVAGKPARWILPESLQGDVSKYRGQVKNMEDLAARTNQAISRRLRPGGTAPTEKPREQTPTGADFFKKFGGKTPNG